MEVLKSTKSSAESLVRVPSGQLIRLSKVQKYILLKSTTLWDDQSMKFRDFGQISLKVSAFQLGHVKKQTIQRWLERHFSVGGYSCRKLKACYVFSVYRIKAGLFRCFSRFSQFSRTELVFSSLKVLPFFQQRYCHIHLQEGTLKPQFKLSWFKINPSSWALRLVLFVHSIYNAFWNLRWCEEFLITLPYYFPFCSVRLTFANTPSECHSWGGIQTQVSPILVQFPIIPAYNTLLLSIKQNQACGLPYPCSCSTPFLLTLFSSKFYPAPLPLPQPCLGPYRAHRRTVSRSKEKHHGRTGGCQHGQSAPPGKWAGSHHSSTWMLSGLQCVWQGSPSLCCNCGSCKLDASCASDLWKEAQNQRNQ